MPFLVGVEGGATFGLEPIRVLEMKAISFSCTPSESFGQKRRLLRNRFQVKAHYQYDA